MPGSFYANITLDEPGQDEIVARLNVIGTTAYVSATVKSRTVIFPEDLSSLEPLAADLSSHFHCPALLVMAYGGSILLYQLYESGERTDAYVSSPHEGLEIDEPAPAGNAEILCTAFGLERMASRVRDILRRPGLASHPYAMAINRHGELARALGLPLFAAGAGFNTIELGELPEAAGFDPSSLRKSR